MADVDDRSGGDRAGAAQAARRVRLPVLLPGEAPEPAGRQEEDALPGLCLTTRSHQPGERRAFPGRQRTLDAFVFAPAGFLLTAVEDLPEMAAKGRARLEGQVRNAHVLGQFAVTYGRRDLTRRLARLTGGGQWSVRPPPPTIEHRRATAGPDEAGSTGATHGTRPRPGRRPGDDRTDAAARRAAGRYRPGHPRLRHPLGLTGGAPARRPGLAGAGGRLPPRGGHPGTPDHPAPGPAAARRRGRPAGAEPVERRPPGRTRRPGPVRRAAGRGPARRRGSSGEATGLAVAGCPNAGHGGAAGSPRAPNRVPAGRRSSPAPPWVWPPATSPAGSTGPAAPGPAGLLLRGARGPAGGGGRGAGGRAARLVRRPGLHRRRRPGPPRRPRTPSSSTRRPGSKRGC